MTEPPVATNFLNSLGTFVNRQNFKTEVYPTGSVPDPIDIWYDKPLYGKVDLFNNSVYISEASLKQISQANNIFAANFVVEAFEDFRKEIKKAVATNRIDLNSQFKDIEPRFAWKSTNNIYHSYIGLLYKNFSEVFMKDIDRNEKVKDFKSFIQIFVEYITVICPAFPISRTAFIRSVYCSPDTSGLIIQLKDENHSIDQVKFERYIQDPSFEFYTKMARRFGFLIDKNAPWRIIVDLASPAIRPYMQNNKIKNLEELFNNLYYKSYETDIDVLNVYITQFYNTYVSANPIINIAKSVATIKDQSIIEHITRSTVTPTQLERDFNYTFWNKLYIFIRAKESSLIMNQNEFEMFVKTANQIETTIDSKKAREYINKRFSDLPNNVTITPTAISMENKSHKVGISEELATFNFI